VTTDGIPGAGARRLQGSNPYPWPYDGVVVGNRLALVVVGAQPAWVQRSVGADLVLATIERLAVAVRRVGGSVVAVRHAAATAAQHRIGLPPARESPGWELCATTAIFDQVVDAAGINGFTGSPLDGRLRSAGVDHLVLTGFGAEAPVDSTLRAANDRGYECMVVTDAVAPFDPVTGAAALSSVTMSGGIFGALATSAELLDLLATPPAEAAAPRPDSIPNPPVEVP
jgi:nicotinamidase-related amidase